MSVGTRAAGNGGRTARIKKVGYHVTEEGAAAAYNNYVADGVVPVKRRERTVQSKTGVYRVKRSGQWQAACKGQYLGNHATEEDAVRADDTEAQRIGPVDINVILPAGDADDGNNAAAPAALALLSMVASAHTHAGAGFKRAGTPTTPAPPRRKKLRLDTSAGAAAGANAVVAVQRPH